MNKEVDMYLDRASVYIEKGDYNQAIEAINNAIKIDPNHAGAYNVLGIVCIKKGNIKEGIANWKKSFEYDQNQQKLKGIIDMCENLIKAGKEDMICKVLNEE
jgi:Tfp pilus assembly protein PilF